MAQDYPNFESQFVPLPQNIPPIGICIDNETCVDYTLVMVDGINKHDILLNIIQVLSDLDLNISKSYISSDGGWFTNIFYVTHPHGHKIRDSNFIRHIRQSLIVAAQNQSGSSHPTQVKISDGNIVAVDHFASDCTALEITFFDRPGIFSHIANALLELSYFMESGELWSNNGHVACILYLKEQSTRQPITDPIKWNYLAEHLASILRMQHFPNELWTVRLKGSTACQIHSERRLHQLMDRYTFTDVESRSLSVNNDPLSMTTTMADKRSFESVNEDSLAICLPQVSIESWQDINYIVVKVRCSDRPKLMFDVVCALTDLDYDIFRGSIISQDSVAYQEYFVRRTNVYKMLNEMEKESIIQSLTGAIERRISRGLKMKVRKLDRHGLLSNVTMSLRENSLSLEKMTFTTEDGLAVGYFHISDASTSTNANEIDQRRLDAVCNEIGRGVYFEKKINECITSPSAPKKNVFSFIRSLGRSLWFHMKRFISNFKFVR